VRIARNAISRSSLKHSVTSCAGGFADDVRCALFALSLVNCRNVSLEEAGAPRRSRKRPDAPRPDFRYSRVVLPSTPTAGPNGDRFGPATKPLQVVRGHFKTYTADAPLYGKHVGTWWWGWHTRGDSIRERPLHDRTGALEAHS
jgi:hypothetical protein